MKIKFRIYFLLLFNERKGDILQYYYAHIFLSVFDACFLNDSFFLFQWINNIEQDHSYSTWPESYQELLKPSFPGFLHEIRRNLYNLVSLENFRFLPTVYVNMWADSLLKNTHAGFIFKLSVGSAKSSEYCFVT